MPGSVPVHLLVSLVRRIGVRLAHYDVGALWHAKSIGVVNDHVNRAYCYTAADRAGARWSASAIAGLLIEGDGANSRDQDGRVGRRIVAHRHASDRKAKQTGSLRIG